MEKYLRKHLGFEISVIYYIATIFIVVCALYDSLIFWNHRVLAFQWSNGLLFAISIFALLLFMRKVITVSTSMAVIIYSVLANFYFIFLSGCYKGDIVTHFLRDSFFIPILFVCLAMVSGRIHLLISSTGYYILMILFAFNEQSHYMFDNLLFFFIIIAGSSIGIYFFIRHLDRNLKQISESTLAMANNNENLLKCKAELELNNDFKNHLISVISHDLRNEMANVKMAIDFMQKSDETMSLDMRHKYQQNLYIASERSMNMLDNFLVWAKSGREGIVFNKEILDLGKVVNASIEQIRFRSEEKKVRIMPHDINYFVKADYYSLLAVVRNLLHNAIKFSDKGSTITIKASHDEYHVALHIIDEGVGISTETLEKLNREELFISTTGTANEKGTGLGLAICFDFVKRNGGHMSISSREGVGTTVIITLDKG